jgi:hypothetical protein
MEAVVHVSPESGGSMKPKTSADEDAADEPFWAVVAGWSTVIRRDVVVTVWAIRRYSYVDSHLGICSRGEDSKATSSDGSQHKNCGLAHNFTSAIGWLDFCNHQNPKPFAALEFPARFHLRTRIPVDGISDPRTRGAGKDWREARRLGRCRGLGEPQPEEAA